MCFRYCLHLALSPIQISFHDQMLKLIISNLSMFSSHNHIIKVIFNFICLSLRLKNNSLPLNESIMWKTFNQSNSKCFLAVSVFVNCEKQNKAERLELHKILNTNCEQNHKCYHINGRSLKRKRTQDLDSFNEITLEQILIWSQKNVSNCLSIEEVDTLRNIVNNFNVIIHKNNK